MPAEKPNDNDKDESRFLHAVKDDDLVIVWCPGCNKMLSNEYKRCPDCGEIVDEEWQAEFEVVKKLEKDLDGLIEAGYYDQALQMAKLIKDIGEKIGDPFLIEQQDALINQISLEIGGVEEIEQLVENCKKVNLIFDKYVKIGKILEAHELVEDFKRVHASRLDDIKNFLVVSELFTKDEEILNQLLSDQAKIENELKELEEEIQLLMEDSDFDAADLRWARARELTDHLFEEERIKHWEEFEYEYLKAKDSLEEESALVEKLAKLEKKVKEDIDLNDFDAVEAKWPAINRMLKKITDQDIQNKWITIKEEYSALKSAIDEQFEILDDLNAFELEIRDLINEGNFEKADKIWLEAGKLVMKTIDMDLKESWKAFKMDYQKEKTNKNNDLHVKKENKEHGDKIDKLQDDFERELGNKSFSTAIKIAKKIIKLAEDDENETIATKYKKSLREVASQKAESEMDTEERRENELQALYKEETGKNAIWRDKKTKQYKKWRKNKRAN